MNACDLETFEKIKSGKINTPFDGTDKVFTVKISV
jgi:hypothetical protein